MYSTLPSFVIGFHGCDKAIGEKIIAGEESLRPSKNSYDWLGHGIYFWENNPTRAFEYATEVKNNPKMCSEKIETPFVVGAVIDLGECFNLLDSKFLQAMKLGYTALKKWTKKNHSPLPVNKTVGNSCSLILRQLDCAVVEYVHYLRKIQDEKPFDSVRAVYREGAPIYDGTDICEKNHIQICVRNPNCIKGYFKPLATSKK